MTNDVAERRSVPRITIDQYYSVDFSIGNESLFYQFKIWDLSPKGVCLLVKENSSVLKHLKVGDIVSMKYYKADSSTPGEYMRTEIRYITKDQEGRFKGHYKVGISIPEALDSSA